MPKVKLHRLARYPFSTELDVRVGDLNYGAHLGYDRVLTLAHQARLTLFQQWNVTEMDLGDGTTGLVVGDVIVNYLGEGFLHDRLIVEIGAVETGAITFRLAHRFSRKADGADVAMVEIGFVGFDYGRRMPSRLPPSFSAQLAGISGGGL